MVTVAVRLDAQLEEPYVVVADSSELGVAAVDVLERRVPQQFSAPEGQLALRASVEEHETVAFQDLPAGLGFPEPVRICAEPAFRSGN